MEIEAKIQKNQGLKKFTHFNIGGQAEFFLLVKKKEELPAACAWAKRQDLRTHILGGGSNILAADGRIKGLVLKLDNQDLKLMNHRLRAGAGATLAAASALAYRHSLSGLEWSAGIPRATMGGAIRGNAEAFGVSMGSLVETVEVFNLEKESFENISRTMSAFSYRDSLFKKTPGLIIWEAVLKLFSDDPGKIYSRIEKSLEFRRTHYPNLPSAGSVFENVDPSQVALSNPVFFERELKDRIGREGKLSAGLIIDLAGLKGKSIGGAKVSLEHANHIVNTGKATASDVAMLISYIKQQVRDRFKIQLKEEVQYFGFDS